MKNILCAAALAALGASVWAQTTPATLRAECAAKHQPPQAAQPQAANEYRFVFYKGQYRGEQRAGQSLPCVEAQYVAYLDTQDPARVMSAYPTAAGRPTAKKQ